MHADAEEAYRSRRWSEAMQAFNAIVVFEPNHARAWLRIGNLHHRRKQLLSAASAYRKAARRAPTADDAPAPQTVVKAVPNEAWPSPIDPFDVFGVRRQAQREDRDEARRVQAPIDAGHGDDTRTKALINLALVNVELAQSALAEIGDTPAELVEARDEAAASLSRTRSQVERRRRPDSPAWRSTRPAGARGHSSERPAAARTPLAPRIDYREGAVTP